MCTNTSDKDQSNAKFLSSQPSDIIDIDSISIPNDFMGFKDKNIISGQLDSYIESNNNGNNHSGLDFASTFEKMSLKFLITYIRSFALKHFYSKEGKCLVEFHKFKSLIDKMYSMISENDFTIVSGTVSYLKIKISLIKIIKHLMSCEKSDIFKDLNDLTEQTKKNRLSKLVELSKEFDICFADLSKFLEEYDNFKKNVSTIKKFPLDKATTSTHSNQAMQTSDKPNRSLENSVPLNSSKPTEICNYSSISAKHLFSYNYPVATSSIMIRSFCKLKAGIWYFEIELYNRKGFEILKIDQNNFDLNNSRGEIIKKYLDVSDRGAKSLCFYYHCRKIVVNSSGILYVLKYGEAYSSFEILSLYPDFWLIKKLESSSFESSGLKEIFIEDIEIYSDSLYMYDSRNECIIVTDFNFNLKHIIKVDIEFNKFKDNFTRNYKARLNLHVTKRYFYIFCNEKIYACKNTVTGMKNTDINIVEKVLEITNVSSDRLSSFRKTVYIGNDSFISNPIDRDNFLVFTKIASTTEPSTYESKIMKIGGELRKSFSSRGIAAFEDSTVYLVEGGKSIKLFKLDWKSE